jgi:hypothetical protein
VVQHHEERLKHVQSIGPLETEQRVNITLDAMAMHLFSIYQNKVVQRHASLVDSRKQFLGKNENHQQTSGFLRNQNPTNRGSFGMSLASGK